MYKVRADLLPNEQTLAGWIDEFKGLIQAIEPFSVEVTTDERSKGRPMGAKRLGALEAIASVAANNKSKLPARSNGEELDALLQKNKQWERLVIVIQEALEMAEDTSFAIRNTLMKKGDATYAILRAIRKEDGTMDKAVDKLVDLFKHRRDVEKTPTDAILPVPSDEENASMNNSNEASTGTE